jgi:hypothetical protein
MLKFDFTKTKLFSWDECYFKQIEYETGTDALDTLITNQEESFETTRQLFSEYVKQELASIEMEHQGSYYSQVVRHEEKSIDELSVLQRYSACLSIFSFFEGKLRDIINLIEQEFEFKIKFDDLKGGDDLNKYKLYLSKVFEVDLKEIEHYYDLIKQQKFIRNRIAHHLGIVKENQRNEVKLVNGIGLVKYGRDWKIIIQEISYFQYLFDNMNPFFTQLIWIMDDKYIDLNKNNPGKLFKHFPK